VRVTVSFLISEAGNMEKKRFVKSRSALLLALIGSVGMFASGNAAADRTQLSFSNYAQVYGYINVSYDSPLLGGVTSFDVRGPQSYDSIYYSFGNALPPSRTTSASASWNIPAGISSNDPIYNAITNFGLYEYSYAGQARAVGNQLGASIVTTSNDVNWENPNVGSFYAYGYSSYNDQWLITNANGRTRKYGAIVVTAQLHGTFPTPAEGSYNSASAYLSANTSFTDRAGVNYNSSFAINADPAYGYYTSGSTSWTSDYNWSTNGVATIKKKLLFEYGTPFDLRMTLQTYSSANGAADFFNTAKITEVELPVDVEFYRGSIESGLEGVTLGNLRYASTLDDPNTNWSGDFGTGGGAIVPGIPEPETYAMLLAGLGLLGLVARRRTRWQDRA
jgi:hypothetical protein